jgi:diacylglycerol kinase
MKERLKVHHISFKNAFAGLRWAFATQPNFLIHAFFAIFALLLGAILKISQTEWLILTFTIVWAFSIEMANTALEAICDLITTEWRREIKIAKDVSAGMMLLVAFGSIVVGLIIFAPKLVALL